MKSTLHTLLMVYDSFESGLVLAVAVAVLVVIDKQMEM